MGSIVVVLSGFASEQDLELGEQIHDLLIKYGFDCESGQLHPVLGFRIFTQFSHGESNLVLKTA